MFAKVIPYFSVVTADGLRKSMTSADYTFMNQSGDMWAYNNTMFFTKYSEDVVAAVCATAGMSSTECSRTASEYAK